jgi:hypothetical protein
MADVTITLIANTDQYVKGIKDAEKATQSLYSTVENSNKKQKGIIEGLTESIKKFEAAKYKAWKRDDIEKYNQAIDRAKQKLDEYDKAGLKAAKSTDSLTATFSKWILSVAGGAVILNKLKDAFLETTGGINLFNQVAAITKTVLNDIVTTGQISIATIRQSIETQRILNDLRLEQVTEGIKTSKLNIEYQHHYVQALDQTLSKEERLKEIDAALASHNEKINIQVEHAQKTAEALRKQIETTRVPSEKMVIEYGKLIEEINNLEAERDASTKRLQSRRSGIIQEENEKELKWREDLNKGLTKLVDDYQQEQIKKQEEYQALAKKLLDDYDKSQIDSLEGKEKLEAQRKFGIAQLKEFKNQLKKLGPITEEQKKMFQTMADNIWKEYYKALAEESKNVRPTDEQQQAISKALIGNIPELPGIIKKDVEKAKEDIDKQVAANEAMEPFSFWKLFGIDPETDKGQAEMDAVTEAKDKIIDVMDEIFEARVDDAQRRRELLDTQISETQQSLEMEMELAEEGYANNVTAQKKQLDKLKIQREQALKEEEAAIKKQRALETITQTGSLITASANIFKSLSPFFPAALPIAIATVAAMFSAFIASKTSAAKASKLAEGGSGTDYGIVTGKRHSQGGENFLDHVEVEKGESWGVLSRPASDKYGKVFHEMVSSFNKNEMPSFMPVTNQVNVENSGPNTRLDRVIKEQKKLNESILRQSQLSVAGNKKIIKSGNKIRIVG